MRERTHTPISPSHSQPHPNPHEGLLPLLAFVGLILVLNVIFLLVIQPQGEQSTLVWVPLSLGAWAALTLLWNYHHNLLTVQSALHGLSMHQLQLTLVWVRQGRDLPNPGAFEVMDRLRLHYQEFTVWQHFTTPPEKLRRQVLRDLTATKVLVLQANGLGLQQNPRMKMTPRGA